MLADIGSVGFKVKNFNRVNMERLEKRWPEVKRALRLAVQLLASFGFTEKTLRADSALLPIAYYMSHRKLDSSYISKSSNAEDREKIRIWLIRSLLKTSGVWGSGLDTLLTALREAIVKHGDDGFPVEKLQSVMAKRGKSLLFSEEEIDELAEMSYGDKRLFSLLTLLFPFVDVTNHHFHVDHIFPRSRFTSKKLEKAGVSPDDIDDFMEMGNRLPNLQLLEGVENMEKRATLPAEWIRSMASESHRTNYCDNHLLENVPESLPEFGDFYNTRLCTIRARIVEMVAPSGSELE